MSAMARASICCCPPDRSPAWAVRRLGQVGEPGERAGDAPVEVGAVVEVAGHAQVLVDRRASANTALPPMSWTMPIFARTSGSL